MKIKKVASVVIKLLLGLALVADVYALGECPEPPNCAPCGEVVTNIPMPSYGCSVQPFQNYMATCEPCFSAGWIPYLGTGFGVGSLHFRPNIPGIILDIDHHNRMFSNTYITEYVTAGLAYSRQRFFLAGELGYYYNSVLKPLFYNDPSSIQFIVADVSPIITITPSAVRLDINARNRAAFDLIPGFTVTPRLRLFTRLGVGYAHYSWLRRICFPQSTFLFPSGLPESVTVVDRDLADKQSRDIADFRLGAGVSFAASRYFAFNINYIHIFSGKVTFTPNASIIRRNILVLPVTGLLINNVDTLLAQNTIHPNRNELLFGATISF
jgi:opacity protein-like surface antigen